EDAAVSLVDNGRGRWTVIIHFRDPPDREAVRRLAAAAAGAEAAKTLTVAHDRARVAPSRIGIEIEAALAFGTGHHGTTRGCLLALDWICKALQNGRA